MDIFRELRGFYDIVEDYELKSGAIALYHALMHRANRSGWKEWFIVSSKRLEAISGQGKTSVWSNLKVLKGCGLIDYRTAKGAKTEFKIISTHSKYEPLCEPVSEREPEPKPERQGEPPLIERAEDVNTDINGSGSMFAVSRAHAHSTAGLLGEDGNLDMNAVFKYYRHICGDKEISSTIAENAGADFECYFQRKPNGNVIDRCYKIFLACSGREADFLAAFGVAIESAVEGDARNPEAYICGVFKKRCRHMIQN